MVGCNNPKSQAQRDEFEQLLKLSLSHEKKSIISEIKSLDQILMPTDTVKLETTKNSLIGSISKVCKHPKGYLILDSQITKAVYLFNDKGKFITVIGSQGQGPAEYLDPVDIGVSANGDCIILEPSQRKIMIFNSNNTLKRLVSLRELNIYPSRFEILDKKLLGENKILLYNLHSDFGKKVKNHKLIIADITGDQCEVINSFGEQEPLLKKLFYDMGTFHCTQDGTIWLANIFNLDIHIFNIHGKKIKTEQRHTSLIPKPHINTKELEPFNRPSESLDKFYSLTALRSMVFLDRIVIATYGHSNRHEFYCMIFDYTGEPLLPSIIKTKKMMPAPIVGFNDNELYGYIESWLEDLIPEEVPNPGLVVYRLKL